eukprot:g5295.t1
MDEVYNVWRYESNEELYTNDNETTITAAAPQVSGKKFRQDYLDIVRSIPGLGIHPSIIPRIKKISEIKTEDESNPMALFDIDGFAADQTILKCNGTMMDSTTLLTLLVVLRKYGNINTLNLSDSGLTSKSIEILAKYLPETSITSLILDYNINIQDSCMEVIASKNNSKLQSISLRGCKINDECISKLVEVLWINGLLIELNLFDNKITDLGGLLLAKMLRYNHSISKLFLGNNQMSSSTVLKFAQAVSVEYGPISSKEKEERAKVAQIQADNPVAGGSGGKKGKKGGNSAGPLCVDEMDEETNICKGNDKLKFLDLSFNGPVNDASNIKDYFSNEFTKFCESFCLLDLSNCNGIDDDLLKIISNKINGVVEE